MLYFKFLRPGHPAERPGEGQAARTTEKRFGCVSDWRAPRGGASLASDRRPAGCWACHTASCVSTQFQNSGNGFWNALEALPSFSGPHSDMTASLQLGGSKPGGASCHLRRGFFWDRRASINRCILLASSRSFSRSCSESIRLQSSSKVSSEAFLLGSIRASQIADWDSQKDRRLMGAAEVCVLALARLYHLLSARTST